MWLVTIAHFGSSVRCCLFSFYLLQPTFPMLLLILLPFLSDLLLLLLINHHCSPIYCHQFSKNAAVEYTTTACPFIVINFAADHVTTTTTADDSASYIVNITTTDDNTITNQPSQWTKLSSNPSSSINWSIRAFFVVLFSIVSYI